MGDGDKGVCDPESQECVESMSVYKECEVENDLPRVLTDISLDGT